MITVRAAAHSRHVLIRFEDNGPGINPEDRPYIFERFYRGEKSRNRKTGGSVLGLAITRRLLEAMGGSIRLAPASASAVGARFEIVLPRAPRT